MDIYNSLVNLKRLKLLEETCNNKEINKLNRRLGKLFKGFSKDSERLLNLLSRIDSSKTQLNNMDSYDIGDRELHIINNSKQLKKVYKNIIDQHIIGFDTEQRPTFKKGESQKPISIIQIATDSNCYIIQTLKLDNLQMIRDIVSNPRIIKIGFGLKNDSNQVLRQFGAKGKSFFDLGIFIKTTFISKNTIGAKAAVSLFLNLKLKKSKNAALSNWETERLQDNQIIYAAEDATAPLDVFYKLIADFPFVKNTLPEIFSYDKMDYENRN